MILKALLIIFSFSYSEATPMAFAFMNKHTCDNVSLIANWRLDETSGTTAADSVGAYTGTMKGSLNGGASVTGKVATALNFNGTTNYIEIADNANLDLQSNMSISVWIYLTRLNQEQKVLYKGHSASPWMGWEIVINASNEPMFQVANTAGSYYSTGGTALSSGQWYHLAAIRSGTSLSIYVNGVLATWWNFSPIAGTVQDGDLGFFIATGSSLANYLQGYIDDIKIYHKALTPTQVSALYSKCR